MPLDKLAGTLNAEIAELASEGRAKAPERVLEAYVPPRDGRGPRYRMRGSELEFLRMNSNSYLSLSHHAAVLAAADRASARFGSGPGAVRFIDGTCAPHLELEDSVARFVGRPAARCFNSAYTSVLGLALAVTTRDTFWIGDELNHNCIIRAMRMANVPRERRSIFKHNDLGELEQRLREVPAGIDRVVVVFDGIFSMRGDNAPLDRVADLVARHHARFRDGVISVMDDSHGIGAYGGTGRGTEEHCGARADVLIGTFGKAFGVNGGFVAADESIVEALRQKADTYIYTNPLGAGDCAAAIAAIAIVDSEEGRDRLRNLAQRTAQLREGLGRLGMESISGPHPVVPLLVRETDRARAWVGGLYEQGILAVALTFPVVPRGDETIRFQVNAAHTAGDIDQVLDALDRLKRG